MSFAAVVERLQTLHNPYPGLRHFDTSESHLFFGRDQQVAELVTRLGRHRFVAVLGVSGSGKSSLVRAGLVPALERGAVWAAGRRWRRVVTQPAGAPFARLAADLAKCGLDPAPLRVSSHGLIEVSRQLPEDESLLLVVDQFEELFRYKDLQPVGDDARRRRDEQAGEAAELVQLLLEASRHHPPVYIVLTMRSDYLGDCAEFRDLPETLNTCQYLVPRMTRAQRKEAIEGPLGRQEIAPALVQRLLNDAGDEPDHLPVLQHALMRTWHHWRLADPERHRRIELEDYEAIGGFRDALDRHANELLAAVAEPTAARIFKRLTARGRGSRERRDPATLAELWAVCGATTADERRGVVAVIDQFRSGDATFLRPLGGDIAPEHYVDITHESLIRLWKKLRDEWLPAEEAAAKTLLDVAGRAVNWSAGSGELLGGRDLERIEDWDRRRNHTTAWALQYIDADTLAHVDAFVLASRRSQRNRVRRSRGLWTAAALLVLGTLGYGAYATFESRLKEQLKSADATLRREYEDDSTKVAEAADLQIRQSQAQLIAQTAPVEPAPVTAGPSAVVKPRVYIQVRSQADGTANRELAAALRRADIVVPAMQVLSSGPSNSELRYFHDAEKPTAREILTVLNQQPTGRDVRLVYVPGLEESKQIRPNHFELWLVPANLLQTLVAQLNDPSEQARKIAGGRLFTSERSNPEAIRLVLDMLSESKLASLSENGRINALYFLNRSDLQQWSDADKKLARDAIERIRSREKAGTRVGQQTRKEVEALEYKLQ